MHSPEVVDDDIEDAENQHEEGCRPLGLEADSNHYARDQTNDRNENTSDAPFPLDHETQEEENKQYSACKQEANSKFVVSRMPQTVENRGVLFLPVRLANGGKTGKRLLPANHRIAKDHEQPSNDRQVSKEESQVEDESVAEALDNDNS